MATITRRTAGTARTNKPPSKVKAPNVDPNQLAEELSKKLTFDRVNASGKKASSSATKAPASLKLKGKQKAIDAAEHPEERTPEQVRIDSMKAVNNASQALSGVIQSGWKASTSLAGTSSDKATISVVQKSATDAEKHLAVLRTVKTGELSLHLDIERAACSVLSKLVALEMVRLPPTFYYRYVLISISLMPLGLYWRKCVLAFVSSLVNHQSSMLYHLATIFSSRLPLQHSPLHRR